MASFTVAALPASTLTSPGNNSTIAASANYDRPTLSWTSVAGPASYSLYMVDNTAGGQVVINSFNVGNVTSYQLSAAQG